MRSRPRTSSSRWAVGTSARTSPASATRTGSSTTLRASPSTSYDGCGTRSEEGLSSWWTSWIRARLARDRLLRDLLAADLRGGEREADPLLLAEHLGLVLRPGRRRVLGLAVGEDRLRVDAAVVEERDRLDVRGAVGDRLVLPAVGHRVARGQRVGVARLVAEPAADRD